MIVIGIGVGLSGARAVNTVTMVSDNHVTFVGQNTKKCLEVQPNEMYVQ